MIFKAAPMLYIRNTPRKHSGAPGFLQYGFYDFYYILFCFIEIMNIFVT